ncbi:MAG: hypothetical protein A4E53_02573 [Pelotomaculum sp. PtaB.Bin104]|nr:MAG: hypothetical protein A4E53_02573 [Pelotomaculum sp. PtaB.Bin104]
MLLIIYLSVAAVIAFLHLGHLSSPNGVRQYRNKNFCNLLLLYVLHYSGDSLFHIEY